MRTIVITGSTRGIGYGLAEAFLVNGCQVCISGRSAAGVEQAVSVLAACYPTERVFGFACDAAVPEQIQALWDAAQAHFGQIDIWINNAGISHPRVNLWEHPPERIQAVVMTRPGARIAWLTKRKVLWHFLMAAFHKRDIFSQ